MRHSHKTLKKRLRREALRKARGGGSQFKPKSAASWMKRNSSKPEERAKEGRQRP